jgi:hypothetical protein
VDEDLVMKVAAAICFAIGAKCGCASPSQCNDPQDCGNLARAAIAAVREHEATNT